MCGPSHAAAVGALCPSSWPTPASRPTAAPPARLLGCATARPAAGQRGRSPRRGEGPVDPVEHGGAQQRAAVVERVVGQEVGGAVEAWRGRWSVLLAVRQRGCATAARPHAALRAASRPHSRRARRRAWLTRACFGCPPSHSTGPSRQARPPTRRRLAEEHDAVPPKGGQRPHRGQQAQGHHAAGARGAGGACSKKPGGRWAGGAAAASQHLHWSSRTACCLPATPARRPNL